MTRPRGQRTRNARGFSLVEGVICATVVALMAVSGASAVAAMARARADLVARVAATDAADVLVSEVLAKAYGPPASDGPGKEEAEREGAPAPRTNTSGAVRSGMASVVEYNGMLLHPITDDAGDIVSRPDLVAEIDVTHVVPTTLAPDPDADTGLVEIRVRVLRRVDAAGAAVGGAAGTAGAARTRDVLLVTRVAYRGRTSVLEAGT